jgi:hypothetical protein
MEEGRWSRTRRAYFEAVGVGKPGGSTVTAYAAALHSGDLKSGKMERELERRGGSGHIYVHIYKKMGGGRWEGGRRSKLERMSNRYSTPDSD